MRKVCLQSSKQLALDIDFGKSANWQNYVIFFTFFGFGLVIGDLKEADRRGVLPALEVAFGDESSSFGTIFSWP